MERSILKELNKSNMTANVNAAKEAFLKRLFWPLFFTLKYTTQLTWESLSGSSGSPVMADVIKYNASAPEKTRRYVKKMAGDIPKTAIKRSMDEKDMNDYNTLSALANDSNKKALLDIVFGDVDFCYTGVLARTEFLSMQALSWGSISLTASNNNGIITETTVDIGIPSGNKTAVSTIWSTAASATPIADIKEKVEAAEDAGVNLSYMIMDKATFNFMVATTEVKNSWALFQNITGRTAIPTLENMNQMLSAQMLPEIKVVNSSVRFENSEHVLSTVKPWKTGYVTLVPEMNVGEIQHGPIAKENSEAFTKIAVTTKKDHVFVSKWFNAENAKEFTEAQGNFFPAFKDVESIYILKTNGTSWA